MRSIGSTDMTDVPGPPVNSGSGESGADVTPSAIAVTRSASPSAFQVNVTGRQPGIAVTAIQATGSAVAPMMMSPHPAIGAKGAGSRPCA